MDAIALLELFLKFEYQRRVTAGHPFGDEAAEVLGWARLSSNPSRTNSISQQRVEALEDWIKT